MIKFCNVAQKGLSCDYLARAPVPISSAFPDTLAQKALTAALSLAVRVVMLSLLSSDGGDACQLRRWAFMYGTEGTPTPICEIGAARRARNVALCWR